ncbi:unnamed protein product [Dimorphilus gyrociliatus]|uniref:Uncharacterized protein n=1 Tax=Dimorphilus gyrociliatus TaxID=2664684 RepID=A0A7I8VSS0_9ANNE|nr:unnamed protein product [Dimorphilus gyrociliatus]
MSGYCLTVIFGYIYMENKVLGFAFAPNEKESLGMDKGFCSSRTKRRISGAPTDKCVFNVVFLTMTAGINGKGERFTDKLANHFQTDVVFAHEALHALGTKHVLKETHFSIINLILYSIQ